MSLTRIFQLGHAFNYQASTTNLNYRLGSVQLLELHTEEAGPKLVVVVVVVVISPTAHQLGIFDSNIYG
jgi:hypothetical protein